MSEIIIERGLLDSAGMLAKARIPVGKAAIVADDTVDGLYGQRLSQALAVAGFEPFRYAFPHGEASKNLENYGKILNFLAQSGLTRTDAVFALGGGVTGDMAGFAAATYLRGVNLVQIPTTLLSCVDSSVGGKTAIDLPLGKNLAGAFYPPHVVLIDPEVLKTLPEETLRDGAAEVVKYGALRDEGLLVDLDTLKGDPEPVIRKCVAIKAEIVSGDLCDNGVRQLLNFGHTFGHAVEKASNYALGHGQAVAVGMSMMARACALNGYCEKACALRLIRSLDALGLPTKTDIPVETLSQIMQADKKRRGGEITLVLLREIGRCELQSVPVAQATKWLREGWTSWT